MTRGEPREKLRGALLGVAIADAILTTLDEGPALAMDRRVW